MEETRVRALKPGEPIPEGAVRIHLYPLANVLRPRGRFQKESLSSELRDKFRSEFDHWTDPKYGDSRPPQEVFDQIMANARNELEAALAVVATDTGAMYRER